ncbi:hypothetical protein F5B19DRAFT_470251 [Rostrohypoxylon terebratum]|nr:hypothetical protein F5B19DRAFT_470251 [Rostrohypoxylon terebratum]
MVIFLVFCYLLHDALQSFSIFAGLLGHIHLFSSTCINIVPLDPQNDAHLFSQQFNTYDDHQIISSYNPRTEYEFRP